MSERYEIVSTGTDSAMVRAVFVDFDVSSLGEQRLRMVADLEDQASLHGALHRLQDLGLEILDVHRLEH